jgi:cbb3-type cytochrome oxidase maturation protein
MVPIGWITLVVISLLISLLAFLWGLRTGQFSDQSRARYLPLVKDHPLSSPKNPGNITIEVYVLLIIVGIALAGFCSSILLSVLRLRG